ncbi:fused MFS/spermidine synthase [candidate division KSB1 bacterium]|nr:fused MFS/spermidine synthase [candidate division KSB1 bacterium]RQW04963.1 MAG: tetratricopeptide repeat protein [candidate division KSB1 bacterium]
MMKKVFSTAHSLLLFVFFLSGASALIYQTVWIRQFGLLFGVDVFAVATVLTAFMAGLALGNLLFGKIVDVRDNAFKLFILIEMGIGLYALFFPIAFNGLTHLCVGLYRVLPLGFYTTQLYRFVIAFLFLLFPTTLMGGTLPVLTRIFVKKLDTLGWNVGRLYSINNLGAFMGCFLAGFILMRAIGLRYSIYVGAGLNLLNVLVILAVRYFHSDDRSTPESTPSDSDGDAVEIMPDRVVRFVLWAFAIEGFTALAYEVIWTRIFIGFSHDKSVYFYTTVILSFIFGLSLGSILIARQTGKKKNLLMLFGAIEVLIGITVIILLSIFPHIGELLNTWRLSYTESWWSSLGREYLLFFLVMIVPTTLMGMTFPIVSVICTPQLRRLGARIGEIGFLDTVGSIFGAFAAGFILIPLLGVVKAVLFNAAINIVIGLVAVLIHPHAPKKLKSGFAGSTIAMLVVLILFAPDKTYFQHWQTRRPGDRLLYYREGADATIAVPQHNDGVKFLSINGSVTAFADYGDIRVHKMLGYLPYFVHEDPRTALVIGLGMGVTAQSLMLPGIDRVDCVEINRGVLEAAGYFAAENGNVLAEERLNMIVDDGRGYLTMTTEKYDIITSNAVHARLSGGLYTKEFYEICKKRLTEKGVMCQWTATNWLTPVEFASLIASFHAVFPHTSLWLVNAGHLLIIGAPAPLTFRVADLEERLNVDKVQADLAAYMLNTPEALLAHFITDERHLPVLMQNAPLNTDDVPIAELSRVVNKMQIPQVVLGLISVKHDLADRLVGAADGGMIDCRERVRNYNLAEKYYLQGVFANNFYGESLLALNMLTQALDLIPDDYRYHEEAAGINLAIARQTDLTKDAFMTFLDNAIEHLNAMIARYPNSAFDWNNLGFAYMNRGQLEEAETAFTRALALAPENPLPRIYRASIYAGRGDAAAAEAELTQVIAHFPHELEAYYRLGLIYEFTNRMDKAISTLEKIVSRDAGYRDTTTRLARLKARR